MTRTRWLLVAMAVTVGSLVLLAGRHPASAAEDQATSEGTIKMLKLPLDGLMAGKLYFELAAQDEGAPSAFKVDVNNWAAIEVLTGARAANAIIRVTYKPDFTVTELEVLEPVVAVRKVRSRR